MHKVSFIALKITFLNVKNDISHTVTIKLLISYDKPSVGSEIFAPIRA